MNEAVSISESGPVGGINYVEVYLVDNSIGDWAEIADFYKWQVVEARGQRELYTGHCRPWLRPVPVNVLT